ncbi:MAG: triose-phosphate isomerase [Phycisphaerales bacterium]|nr:triose-phosphate isomerase [Phycisphaerales bacterium]
MRTRRPFVGGNWKMNGDLAGGVELAETVSAGSREAVMAIDMVVFPAFPYLQSVGRALGHSGVALGAQDLSAEANGAFTGEVSAEMLLDLGVQWVLVGHSERRHVIGEREELVADKLRMALDSGLRAVLCVGETRAERLAGDAHEVVARQLRSALSSVDREEWDRLVIAYEPVWAIGTGVSATPADAREAHREIRSTLASLYDAELSETARVVYGGSLSPGNVTTIVAEPGVDGGLVGGASLRADDFLAIASAIARAA